MYRVRKIRLKMNEGKKEVLIHYEQAFHQEIRSLSTQIQEKGKNIKRMKFDPSFLNKSHWGLYQLALRNSLAIQQERSFHYNLSSRWQKGTFTINKDVLTLFFMSDFKEPQLHIKLLLDEYEMKQIGENPIVRVDLTHDEKFWFANLLISYKEE